MLSRLMVCGAALAFVGWLLQFGLPLNKRVWSPSYVLLTCGLAALLQGLLVWWLDVRPAQHRPAQQVASPSGLVTMTLIFGTNPLFLYIVSELLSIVFGSTGIKQSAYDAIHFVIVNGYWASVAYATLFVVLHLALGAILWKRRIFIKL
jgi:predicted acyltransferase